MPFQYVHTLTMDIWLIPDLWYRPREPTGTGTKKFAPKWVSDVQMLEFCFPCLSRACGVVRIDMVRLKPEVPLFFDPIIKCRLERVRVSEVNIDMCIFVGGWFKTPDPPRVLFLDSVGKHATIFFNLSCKPLWFGFIGLIRGWLLDWISRVGFGRGKG